MGWSGCALSCDTASVPLICSQGTLRPDGSRGSSSGFQSGEAWLPLTTATLKPTNPQLHTLHCRAPLLTPLGHLIQLMEHTCFIKEVNGGTRRSRLCLRLTAICVQIYVLALQEWLFFFFRGDKTLEFTRNLTERSINSLEIKSFFFF